MTIISNIKNQERKRYVHVINKLDKNSYQLNETLFTLSLYKKKLLQQQIKMVSAKKRGQSTGEVVAATAIA